MKTTNPELKGMKAGQGTIGIKEPEWERDQWWSLTYVFQFWNSNKEACVNCFNIVRGDDKTLRKAEANQDYKLLNIFDSSDNQPEFGNCLDESLQLAFYEVYFSDLFALKDISKPFISHFEFRRIIISEALYSNIVKIITINNLELIKDLIFYIIIKGQEFGFGKIVLKNEAEVKEMAANIDYESKKLIRLIEKTTEYKIINNEISTDPIKIDQINFIFNQEEPIQINNSWICKEFVDAFRTKYDYGGHGNWRDNIKKLPEGYRKFSKLRRFKVYFAKSLYDYFTECDLFPQFTKPEKSSILMRLIYSILEYALILVGDDKAKPGTEDNYIRSLLKRK